MFYSTLEEFETNFKFLDRLNTLLFNCWKDKQADIYRDSRAQILESRYRNYISEMRQLSNELLLFKKQIDGLWEEIDNLLFEINTLSNNPEIQGCALCLALGDIDDISDGLEYFVVGKNYDPNNLILEAQNKCHRITTIKNASFVMSL